ncbi:MAG: hypothetical protein CSA34_08315 [Desulfobulbus propionicus]|nr:MAG: hypothetical protein CSA34_08315 [Desulfobulbus propionicus]
MVCQDVAGDQHNVLPGGAESRGREFFLRAGSRFSTEKETGRAAAGSSREREKKGWPGEGDTGCDPVTVSWNDPRKSGNESL